MITVVVLAPAPTVGNECQDYSFYTFTFPIAKFYIYNLNSCLLNIRLFVPCILSQNRLNTFNAFTNFE